MQKKNEYETQDGYVAPLDYTLMAFMVFDESEGYLRWRFPVGVIEYFYTNTDDNAPIKPVINQLGELIVSAVRGDPQALGKASYAYTSVMTSVQAALTTI